MPKQNFDVDQRVMIVQTNSDLDNKRGTILGKSFKDVVDSYIVLLDDPYNGEKGITIIESCLVPASKTNEIKIAIVQDRNGKVTVCGPDEAWQDYGSQMEAAFCWALEAGEVPVNKFWITTVLPEPTDSEIELKSELL